MLRPLKTALVVAVATVVLAPVAAHASDTESYFGKNRQTPGVQFGVSSPGSSAQARGPRSGGGATNARASQRAALAQAIRQSRADCVANVTASAAAGGMGISGAINACLATEPSFLGAAPPPAAVDAPQLAERAAGELNLPTPTLNTSPADPVKALVGLQTWLWVPADQWQTLTASASAGGATVTVTAEPIQSRWDMGEGAVNCAGPGREWRKGLGQNARTDCGYTYKRTSLREPDNKYAVAATLRYRITWACDGNCSETTGDLGTLDSPTSTSQLEVSERQSVVIR